MRPIGNFKELNQNINDVLVKLIENQNLAKLLHYNESNALSQADIDDTTELLYKKIYPYPFSTEVLTQASSILICSLDDFSPTRGQGYKNGLILFQILVNNSLWVTDDGLRPYLILHELDTMFNNQRVIGIGKLNFSFCKTLWASKDYTGFTLAYKVIDFN